MSESEDLGSRVENILNAIGVRFEKKKLRDATLFTTVWKTDRWDSLQIDIVSSDNLVVVFSNLPVSVEGREGWLLMKNWDYNFAHYASDEHGRVIIVSNVKGEHLSEDDMKLSLASVIRLADELRVESSSNVLD